MRFVWHFFIWVIPGTTGKNVAYVEFSFAVEFIVHHHFDSVKFSQFPTKNELPTLDLSIV
jgi:hypothetical protein